MSRIIPLLLLTCSVGCTASSGEPPLDRQNFTEDACTPTNIASLANLTPADAVDFMEIREQGFYTERVGEVCVGATDREACETAFESLGSASGWELRPGGGAPAPRAWIVYTRGDEVGVVGRAEIAEFLAPIDTVADALFLAQIETLGMAQCGESSVRVSAGGYEVITQTSYVCGGGRDESRVEVLTDGSTQVLERAVLDPGQEEICP